MDGKWRPSRFFLLNFCWPRSCRTRDLVQFLANISAGCQLKFAFILKLASVWDVKHSARTRRTSLIMTRRCLQNSACVCDLREWVGWSYFCLSCYNVSDKHKLGSNSDISWCCGSIADIYTLDYNPADVLNKTAFEAFARKDLFFTWRP